MDSWAYYKLIMPNNQYCETLRGWIRGVYPKERRTHHVVYPERSERAQGSSGSRVKYRQANFEKPWQPTQCHLTTDGFLKIMCSSIGPIGTATTQYCW